MEKDIRREKNRREKARIGSAGQAVTDSLERSIAFSEEEKERLEESIRNHIQSCPDLKEDQDLLESVPAIGPVVSSWMTLLLLHGAHFDSAPQAVAYTGIFPAEHQSGSSVRKKPRMSKDGPAVFRAKLYMAAMVASRHNPDVKALYDRLIAWGKAPKSALGAAMRKLVHICFGVIKNRTPYAPQIPQ